MRVTVLGCGSSAGVPVIGCGCNVCTSNNPRNKRTRVSVLIEAGGLNILIDTSPDLRQQALERGITRIDAVLYTHDHADHTNGIDELRSFNYLAKKPLPVYGSRETLETLQKRFAYAFLPQPPIWFRPCLVPHALPEGPVQVIHLDDVPVTLFEQTHGKGKTFGYRIGDFAYSTDADQLPETAFAALAGVRVWIVDCLRYGPSHSHANLEKTLAWIARVKPEHSILTHMAHDFDYESLARELPLTIVPGYDGMIINV